MALSRPTDHDLPFSTWSLTKLADFLVAEGVVDDISHEGLRLLLREEGVSFQVIKTWKRSTDPDYEAKKNRVLQLYAIADGQGHARTGRPHRGVLLRRVRAAQPATAPRQAVGAVAVGGGADQPRRRRRGHLHPHRTGCGICSPATT